MLQPHTAASTPTLTLPATSDLAWLIDLVSVRLRMQIEYDPAHPLLKAQQVTLRTGGDGGAGGESGAKSDGALWIAVSRSLPQRGLVLPVDAPNWLVEMS